MENIIEIITSTRRIYVNKPLGVSGENNVEYLVFKLDNFIEGKPRLEVERGTEKHTIDWENFIVEEDAYKLQVKNSLLTKQGEISMQFAIYNANEELTFKSKIFQMKVENAINSTATIPEEYTTWYETATKTVAEMENLIEDIETKLENGEFDGKDYILTEEDKQEIVETVEPLVITAIQPALDNNLESAKDYTDNAIARDFKDITFNETTMTFIFTRHDNTTFTVDLPIEQTVKDGRFDEETSELVLVLVSGQEIRIPASGLVSDYEGVDTATIQLVISADNKISANIKAGTITKTLLTTDLQQEIDNKVNKTDYATKTSVGIVKASESGGIGVSSSGNLFTVQATNSEINEKTNTFKPIVPSNLEYAVHSVIDSKIINEVTNDTLLLDNNQDARLGELTTLILNMPSEIDERYESCFSFRSGETPTTLTYSATPIKWQGDDCNSSGEFIPEANTNYEISIRKVNDTDIVARVGGY